MDEATRLRLEILSRWYNTVRTRTLRLLVGISDEELSWQPARNLSSCAVLLLRIARMEEADVKRMSGRSAIASKTVSTKAALLKLLRGLKRLMLRFLRDLVFGRRRAAAADVSQRLERLIFEESRAQGQMQALLSVRGATLVQRSPLP